MSVFRFQYVILVISSTDLCFVPLSTSKNKRLFWCWRAPLCIWVWIGYTLLLEFSEGTEEIIIPNGWNVKYEFSSKFCVGHSKKYIKMSLIYSYVLYVYVFLVWEYTYSYQRLLFCAKEWWEEGCDVRVDNTVTNMSTKTPVLPLLHYFHASYS